LTLISRPWKSLPFNALMAASAASESSISTKPNPLDWLE